MSGDALYRVEDWPHGLRCGACDREFVDGQHIAERLAYTTPKEGGK